MVGERRNRRGESRGLRLLSVGVGKGGELRLRREASCSGSGTY